MNQAMKGITGTYEHHVFLTLTACQIYKINNRNILANGTCPCKIKRKKQKLNCKTKTKYEPHTADKLAASAYAHKQKGKHTRKDRTKLRTKLRANW